MFDPVQLIDEAFTAVSPYLATGSATLTPPGASVQVGAPVQLAADELAGATEITVVTEDGTANGATIPAGSTVMIGGETYSVTAASHAFGKLRLRITPPLASGHPAGTPLTLNTVAVEAADVVHLTSESAPVNLADKGVTFGLQVQRQALAVLPESGWAVAFIDPRGKTWAGVVIDVDNTESVTLLWIGRSGS